MRIQTWIWIIVIPAILIGGYYLFFVKSVISATSCSQEAQQVIQEKNLSSPRHCDVETIKIDNENAKLVTIEYGPGMDCPAGCIYESYTGIFKDDTLVDFIAAPNLFHLILDKYEESCASFDYYSDKPSFKKYITQRNGEYFWLYDFKDFVPEDNLGEYKFIESELKSRPTKCVLNGTLAVTSIRNGYANEADFSDLKVEFRNR
jgi:hypothetical protein